MQRAGQALVVAVACLLAGRAAAQVVEGSAFEDLDADGIHDPGEAALDGVPVVVAGADGQVAGTTAAGAFSLGVPPGSCRLVVLSPPAEPDPALGRTGGAWRRTPADRVSCIPDQPGTPTDFAAGLRYGMAPALADKLDGNLLLVSLGDSIAAGVSVCFFDDTDYSPEVRAELDCLAAGSVTRDQRATAGWHSEDLLTPMDGGQPNDQYIPNVIAANPDVVTISIGGNDFLNTEPGTAAAQTFPYAPADLQRSFQELAATRRSVQEILSVLVSELPLAAIEINSVYDNQADSCATTDFHAAAPAIWNEMLRNAAWGQARPVSVGEVEPELAHQDVLRRSCCGERDMICVFDGIHANELGANFIQHAVMESLGRVQVAPTGTTGGFDVGFTQLVGVVQPTIATILAGPGAVTGADECLVLDGVPGRIGPGSVVRLRGFTVPPGLTPLRVVAGVRYRTTAAFGDDTHLFDASFSGFAPPQWTFTGWDTSTPIVGGSGTAGNIGTPSRVNALPDVPNWRDVTAMVTLPPIDDGRVTGAFTWPSPTVADIENLAIQLAVNAVGAPDGAEIEWDGAWIWIYGTTTTVGAPPGEVSPAGSPSPLRVRRDAGGIRVDWGAAPLAETYRVHRGQMGDWDGSVADPGEAGGCTDQLTWLEPVPADDHSPWFFLVSAVNAAGSGPLGFGSDGSERLAAVETCP